jgi:hypothetical protein
MKVLRFNKTLLRNEEWFKFFTDYFEHADTYGASKIGLSTLYPELRSDYDSADLVLQTLRKSYYTTQIEAANTVRTDAFRSLYGIAKGFQGDPTAKNKDAAMHLFNLLQSYYKNIVQGSYSEESASIYNLLDDLNNESYDDNIELLGLANWVQALRTSNNAFLNLWDVRAQEEIEKPKENFYVIRKQMDTIYNGMVTILDSQLISAGLGGDVVVEPKSLDKADHESGHKFDPTKDGNITYNFVVDWNTIVKKYRNLASQHTGRKDKDKDVTE